MILKTQSRQPTLPEALTFDQFLSVELPEDGIYELVNGVLVRKQASRGHDVIADLVEEVLRGEVRRLSLPYRVTGRAVIRTTNSEGREQGRQPDVGYDSSAFKGSELLTSRTFPGLQLKADQVFNT
jgi:hypothetical protein